MLWFQVQVLVGPPPQRFLDELGDASAGHGPVRTVRTGLLSPSIWRSDLPPSGTLEVQVALCFACGTAACAWVLEMAVVQDLGERFCGV